MVFPPIVRKLTLKRLPGMEDTESDLWDAAQRDSTPSSLRSVKHVGKKHHAQRRLSAAKKALESSGALCLTHG